MASYKPKRPFRAYTTRKLPLDLLQRLRVLAAAASAKEEDRVTMEAMHAAALRRGIPLLEKDIL